jgi:hypothetical protein
MFIRLSTNHSSCHCSVWVTLCCRCQQLFKHAACAWFRSSRIAPPSNTAHVSSAVLPECPQQCTLSVLAVAIRKLPASANTPVPSTEHTPFVCFYSFLSITLFSPCVTSAAPACLLLLLLIPIVNPSPTSGVPLHPSYCLLSEGAPSNRCRCQPLEGLRNGAEGYRQTCQRGRAT